MIYKIAAFGLLIFCAGVFKVAAELKQREWNVDGVIRQAMVWIPEATATNGLPLVFAFHGHGGNMQGAATGFAFHNIWPEAVVVYIQGLPTPDDPDDKLSGWQNDAGSHGDRDLKCFDTILSSLQQEYKIDPKRIYATGHSNGGSFTYLLWAERGDVLAAVAPSAAAHVSCMKNLKPKPALHVAGEKDSAVEYDCQIEMMDAVRKLNGCVKTGVPWASSGEVVGTLYPSKSGTPFVSLIYPGTHKLPGEVPALIVRFFKENVRK